MWSKPQREREKAIYTTTLADEKIAYPLEVEKRGLAYNLPFFSSRHLFFFLLFLGALPTVYRCYILGYKLLTMKSHTQGCRTVETTLRCQRGGDSIFRWWRDLQPAVGLLSRREIPFDWKCWSLFLCLFAICIWMMTSYFADWMRDKYFSSCCFGECQIFWRFPPAASRRRILRLGNLHLWGNQAPLSLFRLFSPSLHLSKREEKKSWNETSKDVWNKRVRDWMERGTSTFSSGPHVWQYQLLYKDGDSNALQSAHTLTSSTVLHVIRAALYSAQCLNQPLALSTPSLRWILYDV